MAFKLSLHRRRQLCEAAKARYHRDPATRLAVINAQRARRGVPPISDLSEMGDPSAGRRNAKRDDKGRFA